MGNGLSLFVLFQLSFVGVQGFFDLLDESEVDLDEFGMLYFLFCIIVMVFLI